LTPLPKYYGTKMGAIIKTITIESKHSWREIQHQTNFTEKELNYNLAQLFNQGAITKENGQYYANPALETEWQNYYKTPIITIQHLQSTLQAKTELNTPRIGKMGKILLISILILGIGAVLLLGNSKIPATFNKNPTSSSSTSTSTLPSTTTITSSIRINLIATVTKIYDGDTFETSSGTVFRLADIDAPDRNDAGYSSSTDALSNWIMGKRVYLDIDDLYRTELNGDRVVCVVYVSSGSSYLNVNQALVNGKYAETWDLPNEFNPKTWPTYASIDTSQASQDSAKSSSSGGTVTPDGPFLGSKNSNIYHKPSCTWAQQISSSNLRVFGSRSEAEAAGYRPCKVCNP